MSLAVSVIVPTYNQERFVEEAVLSVVLQDYDHLQVVVCDDASQDNTPAIVQSLAAKYPDRITLVLNERNLGITRNANQCLQRCTGDVVAFSAGDDIFLPGKIAKQVAVFQENPHVSMVAHDVEVFDSQTGQTIYHWRERYAAHRLIAANVVRFGPFIPGLSIMVRRPFVEKGYDMRVRWASDWLLWVSALAAGGEGIYLPDVLARYRRHTENISIRWDLKLEDQLITLAIIASQWPEFLSAVRYRRSALFFTAAVYHAARKHYGKAWRYFWEGYWQTFPLYAPAWRLALRELRFMLRQQGKDDLLRSLAGGRR